MKNFHFEFEVYSADGYNYTTYEYDVKANNYKDALVIAKCNHKNRFFSGRK